jgi:hypothetical protein
VDTTVLSTPPAPPPGLEQQARSVLARLSRAVQKASIYPPGHPAVAQGMGPLVDSLAALVAEGPVSFAIGRTRILVASGANPPTEHESPWLATRLFDKGISAISVDEVVDAQDVSRLVTWLAGAMTGASDDQPEIAGVRLSRFDGSRLRFHETDSPSREPTPEAAVAWQMLTSSLADLTGLSPSDREDPSVLADRIREALLASEGTGISELSGRFVSLHDQLQELDHDSREVAGRKLAALIERLLPELRGSLLVVRSNDDAKKVELVGELLDYLSAPVVHHIVENLGVERVPVPPAFDRFLRKLARMSLADPSLAEGLDKRFQQAGLPISLLAGAAPDPRRPFNELPPDADTKSFVPEQYRARLEELITKGPEGSVSETPPDVDPTELTAIERHIGRIARLEAGREELTSETTVYLRWLRDMTPRELARRGLDSLAETAELMIQLAGRELSGESKALVDSCIEFYRQPVTVEAVLAAIAEAPSAAAGSAGILLSIGGRDSARVAVEWLKGGSDVTAREHVAAALAEIDPTVFREVVASELHTNRRLAESMAGALPAIEPSRAIDLALQLASNAATEVRRKAFTWLLATPLTSGKLGLVLQKALDDLDPRVVLVGLEAAEARPSPGATEALLKFIHRRAKTKIRPLQARAVKILSVSGPEAVKGLAKALGQRRVMVAAKARRLSLCMAEALSRSSEPGARGAARAWRTSLSSVICWVARTEAERE